MKKYKLFTLLSTGIVAATMGFSSCADKLDLSPIDYYGSENFWTSEDQAIGNISAMMTQFRGYNFQTVITYGEIRGGAYTLETTGSDGAMLNVQYLREQNLSVNNYGVSNFGGYWGLVANANLFIDRVTDADYFTDEDTKNYCLGMVYGMRAYYYFLMYRAYGGVPLRLTPDVVDGNYDATSLYMARAEASEVMAQIKSDIATSLSYFGTQTTFNFDGASKNAKYYWSKAATEMLAGEVYLWNSKVTTGNQSATKSDLSTAKTYFQNVINNYGLALEDKFTDVFSTSNKQNDEIIFAFQCDEDEVTNGIPSSYMYGIVTGYTIGTAYDIDGNLWNNPDQVASTVQRYQFANALWYQFDAEDTRRDATFSTSWHDTEATQLRGTFVHKNLGEISSSTGYMNYSGDQPLYRLAEAYLALAEIANMEGSYSDVASYINLIRARAYGDNWDEDVYGYTAGTFLENEVAILHEKDKEFVQEGQRWWDIRRMTVSADCGETDHLLFHEEGHIAYGLDIDDDTMRELSPDSWDAAATITVEPILSSAYAYRALWPVDASTLSYDPLLEQTPGYDNEE